MEVPEPSSAGSPGNLLMEHVPRVREGLMRGRDWQTLAAEAASGTFSAQDDAGDPDVRSVATLFAGSEHEDWGTDSGGVEELKEAAAPATSV